MANHAMTAAALDGIRVAEFGSGAALAYCGKLFADFGAGVIKIEPPGGDPGRLVPPLVDRGGGVAESGVFAWLNTNKRSVAAAADDGERIRAIVAASDVLLDARPGADADPGETGHTALRAAFPALTIVALSWFGDSGPYRHFAATDSVVRALAGLVKQTGPEEGPLFQPQHQAEIPAALCAFSAALAALLSGSPRGRRFEISIHDANVVIAEYQAATAVQLQLGEARRGVNRWFPTFPMGIYPCREGWLGITVLTADQWRGFCDMLGMAAQAGDPRYANSADRIVRADELEAVFVPLLQARTARDWFAEGLRRRLPFVIVPTMAELLAEPVYRGRGAIGTVQIGDATFEAPVLPLRLTRTPPAAAGRAPLAGADTREWRPAPAVGRHDGGARLPLAGIRIVDLTMGWAGPLATRQMADLGAEIIKVEGRAYPDWWRGADYSEAGIAARLHETRHWFNIQNRNKIGITLDLTHPDGAGLLRDLVRTADAVVENYSQGVLPKLGLAYPDLSAVQPDLVMVSMPAFGADTEWAEVRAYGSTLEQGSGLPSVTGNPDGPPTMSHIAYGDPIGGLSAAAALLVALLHRKRTGEGQHVNLSQVECMLPLVAPWIIEQSITGRVARRVGNRHSVFVPHGCFRCAGEDAWIVIAVTDDKAWRALCAVIDRPELAADPAFATAAGRRAAEDRLEAAIGQWTGQRPADAAMQALQARQVAAGVARSFADIMLREPHLQARGFWQEVERPFLGRHLQPSAPFREEAQAYPIRNPAPTLGQSTRDVLSRILDLSEAELDRLEAAQIIGVDPIPASERRPRSAALLHAAGQRTGRVARRSELGRGCAGRRSHGSAKLACHYEERASAVMRALHVNHVLSTGLLKSYIFEDLFYRTAALAPDQLRVTQSVRPYPRADAWHYHRPNFERRLLPRSVATVHHDLRDDHGWLKLKYFIPRYREAAVVHCLNRTQQAVLRDHGIFHSCVIPHGVDRRMFPSPAYPRQVKSDRLCLGVCSRRYPSGVKGEDLFESLLRHLDPRRISFVLVGEGRRQDAELARSKGFEAACWEYLPYPLMREVYARMDALLILSWFEGGPASLPEALGSGVPVICTPVGMCADFVEDGMNGLLLTRQAMSDGARIMALTDDAGRGMAVLNDGAFLSAPTIPSWDAVMAEWHQLYRKAAEAADIPLHHRRSSAAPASPTTRPTEQNRRAFHPKRAARSYMRDILPPPFPGSNHPVVLVCDPTDCGAPKSLEITPPEICRHLIRRMLEQSDANLIFHREVTQGQVIEPVLNSLSQQYRLRFRVNDAVPLAEILRYVDIFVACSGYALIQGWRSGLKPLQIGNNLVGSERFSHVFPDIEALVQSVTHGLATRFSLQEYSEMAATYPSSATFDEADTARINNDALVERRAPSALQSIERNSRTLLQIIRDASINPLAASRLVVGLVGDLRQDRRYFSV